jgi:ammonia channel protein AmtB
MLGKSVCMDLDAFKKILSPIVDKTYFWEGLSAFTQLGADILARWFVAATVLAVVSSFVGYVVTYRLQSLRCKRAAEKMGLEYEAYVEELEDTMSKRAANRPPD